MSAETKILQLDFDILHADLLEAFLNEQLKNGFCLELVSHRKGLFRETKNVNLQYKVKVFMPKQAYRDTHCPSNEKEKLFLKEWSNAGFICVGKIDYLYIFKATDAKVPLDVKDESRFIRTDFLWNKIIFRLIMCTLPLVSWIYCYDLLDSITYNVIVNFMLCYLLFCVYLLTNIGIWLHYKYRLKHHYIGSLMGMKAYKSFSVIIYILYFLTLMSGFILDGIFLPNWSLITFTCCFLMVCLSIYIFIVLSKFLPYKIRLISVGIITIIGIGIISLPKWYAPIQTFFNSNSVAYTSKNSTLVINKYYNYTLDNYSTLQYIDLRFKNTSDYIFNHLATQHFHTNAKIYLAQDLYNVDEAYYTQDQPHKLYLKRGKLLYIYTCYNKDITSEQFSHSIETLLNTYSPLKR